MTNPHPHANRHVYLRDIDAGERTSLSVLASLIRPGSTILDLGCGNGALGAWLAEHGQCICDGITYNPDEARLAQASYRRVEVADLEDCDLTALFAAQQYDCIVCADVLEHLRQPDLVLAAAKQLLRPGGMLLASVPNASYCGLVAELMAGEFRYRDEGLLDRTHLRFFTRPSLLDFFRDAGWHVDSTCTIRRELPESEFKNRFDELPPAVARHLLGMPDALTYQFIVQASPQAGTPADAQAPVQDADHQSVQAHALFTAAVYMATENSGYVEDNKIIATGAIGSEKQAIVFHIPPAASSERYSKLRLDPADRPGFIHLFGMTLRNPASNVLWQWDASRALEPQAYQHTVMQPPVPGATNTLFLLYGPDPWLELPVPQQALEAGSASGMTLEVEAGWPMSADYLAFALPFQRHMAQQITRLENELTELRPVAAEQPLLLEQKEALLTQQRLLLQQRNELQAEKIHLEQTAADLKNHLQFIQNSTIFRATRPLVRAKMRLDHLLGRNLPNESRTDVLDKYTIAMNPVQAPSHPVDIIVPVYRGLDDTRCCIESVLNAACSSPWRLIVINDASPEPEVTAWLREKAAAEPRITLLENEENLGFVATVNRGMQQSDSNDVVLLNSDAEVAGDWLDRLRRAAWSNEKIATVTPFSNHATIFSYPRFCKANPMPCGWDTARLDALFARVNAGSAPIEVPTAMGFCMYIRRDSLRDVGLFDAQTFGKGYGEENDFCRKAIRKGWRHVHALDTFVRHAGGVSFGESKSQRELDAMEILRHLYPDYEADVHRYVADDPAQSFRHAVDLQRLLDDGLPVVLAVAHNRGGGTLRHVQELAATLHGRARFLLLSPMPGNQLSLRMASQREGLDLRFSVPDEWQELTDLLRAAGVAHIHFHHLIGHDNCILDLPAVLDVGYDCTIHDFYAWCLNITMTGHNGKYSGEDENGLCQCCHYPPGSPDFARVHAHREQNRRLLGEARCVFTPGLDAARRMTRFTRQANICLAPHTDIADPALLPAPVIRPLKNSSAPLRVAVLGALSVIKGADVLENVATLATKCGAAVEFHLLGFACRSLRTQPRAALTIYGEYQDEDLPALLEWLAPDVVWFPAQWPETYSYTLSACLEGGFAVVAPDIGAFASRLQQRPWSWLRPWSSTPQEWLTFFENIRQQHFLTAEPPLPPPAINALPEDALIRRDWSYLGDYTRDLAARAASPDALHARRLCAFQAQNHATPAAQTRSLLLRLLVRLRSAPGLRMLARAVPQSWQRRVKDRLSA